jgi:PTH1 family peptidyl-tRNA hydrolase
MGLFAKQPYQLNQILPYSISFSERTKLIVGLGNPGKEYNLSRHNAGFEAIDYFANKNGFIDWKESGKFKGWITENTLGKNKLILLKPNVFMNLSGESVQALISFYKSSLKDILVVHDELSIPFGQIRCRVGGQDAGHNGIKSIIEHIGKDFGRVRIGIKNELAKKWDQSDFVLAKFQKEEQALLPDILSEANAIITEFIYGEKLPHETRKIDAK